MRERDHGRLPAMLASLAAHAGVLAAALIVLPRTQPLQFSDVVPVTLMTSADVSARRTAVQAPEPAEAATETPAPDAPPVPPAPVESPTPAPAPSKPAPQPKVATPVPTPKPAPATKAQAKPAPDMDFDALAASINKSTKQAGAKRGGGLRGPARPQADKTPSVTVGAGTAVSAVALASMKSILQRLWNPDCGVMGAADVNIEVTFRLGPAGRLIGDPKSSAAATSNAMVQAASDRAIRAVYQGQPFANLPADMYRVTFNPKTQCAEG